MTQDEIIEMAVQAKLYSGNPRTPSTGRMIEKRLEAFAKLVAAKAAERERDACVKRAEIALLGTLKATSERVLKAIRARGEA